MKRTKRFALALGACALGVGVWLAQSALDEPEAAAMSDVIVMRCLAMTEPSFSYQVASFSKTPTVNLEIDASTVDGEGDSCAVAIAQALALPGMSTNRMTMYASENAVVVTFIK